MSALAPNPVGREVLDDPACDVAIVRATLADIALSNRWFGGRAAVARGVERLLERHDGAATLLDVGAGGGDIVRYLAQRAAQRRRTLRSFVLERHRDAARLCRAAGLPAVQGDAACLPFATGSVDIVIASQLLHHVDRKAAVLLVRELNRVARIGVVIADLRRASAAMAGIWLASYLLAFHPASRHDGVVSVRRGFADDELADLLRQAGVEAHIERRRQFRLVATWRSSHANG